MQRRVSNSKIQCPTNRKYKTESSSSTSKPQLLDKDRTHDRVLGMVCSPAEDTFTFSQQAVEEVVDTSCAVLTNVKLYSDAGDLAQLGTDWDKPIAELLHVLWVDGLNSIGGGSTMCTFSAVSSETSGRSRLTIFRSMSSRFILFIVGYQKKLQKPGLVCVGAVWD